MKNESLIVTETRNVRTAISQRFKNSPDKYIDYLIDCQKKRIGKSKQNRTSRKIMPLGVKQVLPFLCVVAIEFLSIPPQLMGIIPRFPQGCKPAIPKPMASPWENVKIKGCKPAIKIYYPLRNPQFYFAPFRRCGPAEAGSTVKCPVCFSENGSWPGYKRSELPEPDMVISEL